LDELDKGLEKRGHQFCRYADDCNIYVRIVKSGERVMASVGKFIEGRLKLEINRQKSKVGPSGETKFLGYRIIKDGILTISPVNKAG
jgi:retron-type reverse transcriptase